MLELLKAIKTKAINDSDLQTATAQSGNLTNGIFTVEAPTTATTPYIVINIIDQVFDRTFEASSDVKDSTVQFTIVVEAMEGSAGSTPQPIGVIRDKLVAAFDRQVLTYDTETHVGCLLEIESGPERFDNSWQWTLDFRIMYQ